jgi:hypothetical protein
MTLLFFNPSISARREETRLSMVDGGRDKGQAGEFKRSNLK